MPLTRTAINFGSIVPCTDFNFDLIGICYHDRLSMVGYHISLPSYLVFTAFSTAGPSNTAFLANTFTVYSVSLCRPPVLKRVVPGSVILTFFISVLPFSITTRYAVIGLPPSSAGAVHSTVSEVD